MKIKYINLSLEQIEQLKKWKAIPKSDRQYRCPFDCSASGGKLCAKAFKRCQFSNIPKPNNECNITSGCPCGTYSFDYVMRQINKAIKYGRI